MNDMVHLFLELGAQDVVHFISRINWCEFQGEIVATGNIPQHVYIGISQGPTHALLLYICLKDRICSPLRAHPPWSQATRMADDDANNRSSGTSRSLSVGVCCKDGRKKGSSLFCLWEQKKEFHQQNLESNIGNMCIKEKETPVKRNPYY